MRVGEQLIYREFRGLGRVDIWLIELSISGKVKGWGFLDFFLSLYVLRSLML